MISSEVVRRWEKARAAATNHVGTEAEDAAVRPALGEQVPEAERLVTRTGHDRAAIRRHCQIENSVSVASQCCELLHGWVLPHDHLVETVAVSADQFVVGL